jgi:hypothetical protein
MLEFLSVLLFDVFFLRDQRKHFALFEKVASLQSLVFCANFLRAFTMRTVTNVLASQLS